jgi:hypothetical protein
VFNSNLTKASQLWLLLTPQILLEDLSFVGHVLFKFLRLVFLLRLNFFSQVLNASFMRLLQVFSFKVQVLVDVFKELNLF